MDGLILVFLMDRLATVDEDEFFNMVPGFLIELGFTPAEICRLVFELGELVGHVAGHLCAENEQAEVEAEIGGYL